MKMIYIFLFIFTLHGICYAKQSYVMPPTSSTRGHVPVISDEQMEQCVKVYNESEWLNQELDSTYVDRYSQSEVNAYNRKVNKVNAMKNWFNANCAGKQSRSACEAANKLNREKGLPEQRCY